MAQDTPLVCRDCGADTLAWWLEYAHPGSAARRCRSCYNAYCRKGDRKRAALADRRPVLGPPKPRKPIATPFEGTCQRCGLVSMSAQPGKKWCSERCKKGRTARKSRPTCSELVLASCRLCHSLRVVRSARPPRCPCRIVVRPDGPLACEDCGQDRPPRSAQFCSDCAARRLADRRRRIRRAAKKKRGSSANRDRGRARRAGVAYEPIDRRKVYARDGWRCGICRKAVNSKLKYPDPMSASLDHIVPIAAGGGHLYSNVQCAHWECNVLKSDHAVERGEQLLLLG